jgi:hypothetical protein
MAPFRALDPDDLRHRALMMQERPHTFTLAIHDGQVDILGPFAELRRATDMADLVRRFAGTLPLPVNMTFIVDDSPAVLLQHESKARMAEMASTGERTFSEPLQCHPEAAVTEFGPSEYMPDAAQSSISNFARACPPESPLRLAESSFSRPTSNPAQKTFIWDATTANDVCQHPYIKAMHGHTQTQGTEVTPLVPLFAWAKMGTHSDILVTPLEQYWDSYIGDDPDWSRKSHSKLLWRGSTTGAEFTVNAPWKDSQRARLHLMSREENGTRPVLWADEAGQAHLSDFDVGAMNKLYLVRLILQCGAYGADAMCRTPVSLVSRPSAIPKPASTWRMRWTLRACKVWTRAISTSI